MKSLTLRENPIEFLFPKFTLTSSGFVKILRFLSSFDSFSASLCMHSTERKHFLYDMMTHVTCVNSELQTYQESANGTWYRTIQIFFFLFLFSTIIWTNAMNAWESHTIAPSEEKNRFLMEMKTFCWKSNINSEYNDDMNAVNIQEQFVWI